MITFVIFLIVFLSAVSSFFAYKKVIKTEESDVFIKDKVVLHIKLPKSAVDATEVTAESMFANLHGLLGNDETGVKETTSFDIIATPTGLKFYAITNTENKSFLENQIYAYYPQVQIEVVDDYITEELENQANVTAKYFHLSKKDFFPIKTISEIESDPLAPLLEVVSDYGKKGLAGIQFVVRPEKDNWQQEGFSYISELKGGAKNKSNLIIRATLFVLKALVTFIFPPKPNAPKKESSDKPAELNSIEEAHIKNIQSKLKKMGFKTTIRVFLISKEAESNSFSSYFNSVLASFKQFTGGEYNSFLLFEHSQSGSEAMEYIKNRSLLKTSNILNTEELATLVHFPTNKLVFAPNVSRAESKRGEPPLDLPIEGDINFFGTTNFRNESVKFGIKNGEDRLRHMYFVGKTGVGKSTLFENMIIQDIIDGRGCGYIDPHGDTIEKILKRIPKNRIEDVVLIDPSNEKMPVGINVLQCPDPLQKNLLASSVLSAFKLQFGYSWGPRLEYLLNYALLTLIEVDGTTLLSVSRLLTDKNYRKYILEKVTDPMVLKFWNNEYAELENAFGAEAVSPIQNKVNRLLSSTTLRNILGQRNSTISFDEVMNNKKILLVNLSKGLIGDDNASLLGSLIVNRLTFYAMQRAKMSFEDRMPFYLFVDEFQNFATESFVTILSEARKYGLSLNLTHQYTAQLPEPIKDAILGNVGTIVAFTVGSQDAKVLSPEFFPVFDENDMIVQEKYNFYCKLHINGATSKPFSGKSLPPIYNKDTDLSKEIKKYSFEKYGKSIDYVEQKIKTWLDRPFDVGMAIAERYKKISDNNITN